MHRLISAYCSSPRAIVLAAVIHFLGHVSIGECQIAPDGDIVREKKPTSVEELTALIDQLRGRDRDQRDEAYAELSFRRELPALTSEQDDLILKLVRSRRTTARLIAVDLLARTASESDQASKMFRTLLQDNDPLIRLTTVWALRNQPKHCRNNLGILLRMLDDETEQSVRMTFGAQPMYRIGHEVIGLLATFAEFEPHVLPILTHFVENADENEGKVKVRAATGLARFGQTQEQTDLGIRVLTESIRARDSDARNAAIYAIMDVELASEPVIRGLVECVEHKESVYATVSTLKKLGNKAAAAVPKLREMASDHQDREVRIIAQAAIDAIEGTYSRRTAEASDKH